MFNMYELYDLHHILVSIRSYRDNPLNIEIVSTILSVLDSRSENGESNQLRKALQSVKTVDKYSIYDFVFIENYYTYYPSFLKNEYIYSILSAALKELPIALNEGNLEKIYDLADCLHDLPIIIVENNYSIPKRFWKVFIKSYRNKWNKNFLKTEEKYKNKR